MVTRNLITLLIYKGALPLILSILVWILLPNKVSDIKSLNNEQI